MARNGAFSVKHCLLRLGANAAPSSLDRQLDGSQRRDPRASLLGITATNTLSNFTFSSPERHSTLLHPPDENLHGHLFNFWGHVRIFWQSYSIIWWLINMILFVFLKCIIVEMENNIMLIWHNNTVCQSNVTMTPMWHLF